jgi:hypothetical protein
MKEKIKSYLVKIQSLKNLRKITINKKSLIFLFFVGIASIFWLLNALSKEYTATIDHPIRYYNFPNDKVLVGKLPNYISIKVNAFGFSILKYKYKLRTSFDAIDLNVKQLGLRKITGSKSKYYILTRYEQAKISKQLKKEIKLLEIYPDTIYFHLADIVSKKVLVAHNVDFTLDKQTMLNGNITLNPDSIVISGPQTIIDTIDSVFTSFQDYKLLTARFTRNIGLKPIEGIIFKTKRIVITIPAEKFTEKTIKKELEIMNLPDSLSLKAFPNYIDISYQYALSNFEKISDADFVVSIDYNDIKSALSNKLKVQMESSPEQAKKIKYFPTHIEFIVEKND